MARAWFSADGSIPKCGQITAMGVDPMLDPALGDIARLGNAHGEEIGGHGNGLTMTITPQVQPNGHRPRPDPPAGQSNHRGHIDDPPVN
jgi:hypothetical protein